MRVVKTIVFAVGCLLFVMGCSSTGPESPTTEVDGMVVSDGEDDMEREFSDEEVAQFAETYVEVTAVQQQYDAQMQEADEAERQALLEESRERSEETIIEHGMTAQEYNAIAVRLPTDDQLRERVRIAIQERDAHRIEETEQRLGTEAEGETEPSMEIE